MFYIIGPLSNTPKIGPEAILVLEDQLSPVKFNAVQQLEVQLRSGRTFKATILSV